MTLLGLIQRVFAASTGLLLGCDGNLTAAPDFAAWPLDATGYDVEELPIAVSASYARGDDVYFGLPDGEIRQAQDSRLTDPWTDLGRPLDAGPRMLFVSCTGAVFAAANLGPVYRTSDVGGTWRVSLDVPVWRMDEDDQGSLYAGNYTQDREHVATIYKSADDGGTWNVVFEDVWNRHIHTVRWDDRAQRLYIAFGDSGVRGRAYSDDRGATFHDLARGYRDGPTDVAFTRDYIFWCTDVASGQILRVSRETGATEVLTGRSQYIWFGVSHDEQIYAGTVTSAPDGGERAALLASYDQGDTWQKLLETEVSAGPYLCGFSGESRELSAGGWLYCTGGAEGAARSYRVRRAPGSAP